MRKTGSILVALLLLFGLTACGGPGNEPESESVPCPIFPGTRGVDHGNGGQDCGFGTV